jgi:Domain of unknown function (DUF4157)
MFANQNRKDVKQKAEKSQGASPAIGEQAKSGENPLWQSIAINSLSIQPKLAVGAVDDPCEREADQVADRVMRMTASPAAAFGPSVSDPYDTVRRKCAECEEEDETKLQRKEASSNPAKSNSHAVVEQTLSSAGQPLDASTRAFFEPRFGRDLSDVRVHTDSAAGNSARAVAARAYTVGNHVVFAPGEFVPHAADGRRLIAHELTHVAQQAGRTHETYVARTPTPAASEQQVREDTIRGAIRFLEGLQLIIASDRDRARRAVTTARGPADGARRAHPLLNQAGLRPHLTRARSIYDAQRTQLDPNHALLGDLRQAYANFLGEFREAVEQAVEIARNDRAADIEEQAAYTETLALWLEASPLRDQALAGRTTFTAADVAASTRQETDIASALPAAINRILPTLNLVQAGASARLRAIIDATRSRITAPTSGTPTRTTATGVTQTAADAALAQVNGAEQAVERGRVLLRAAIARFDVWLNAPTQPIDVADRVNELFHTRDPGYGRLLRDRLQLMLTNLEGRGTLVVRLHQTGDPRACTSSDTLGERTAPYEFVFCSISANVDSNAGTLLHELAHAVIPGRGTRGSAAAGFPLDRAYPGERLMVAMTTEEALNNAESYSHLIRVLAGVPVRPVIVDTAPGCADPTPLFNALALAQSAHRRAWTNLSHARDSLNSGGTVMPWLRTLIDTHLSTPANPILLEMLGDFEVIQVEATGWHIGHAFACLRPAECPANAIAVDDRRIYRNGSVTSRARRGSRTPGICAGFFALSADERARAAHVMVSLGFVDTSLRHPDRVWAYASLALAIYQSDLGAPPATSLAEHQAADAAPTPATPTTPPPPRTP